MSTIKPQVRKSSVNIERILSTLAEVYPDHPMDDLTGQNAFKVLIACIMSLRTKDETTIPAAARLFAMADTPQTLVKLSPQVIQKTIFPVGFYKTKSETILGICRDLLEKHNGIVPNTIDELLTLKGVGRKTANLVVGLGYRLPAVCVDTHVHRICNRFGYIQTKTPDETETVLRQKLSQSFWPIINKVLVRHGQELCKPIGPRCDACPVAEDCQKIDVKPRKVVKK